MKKFTVAAALLLTPIVLTGCNLFGHRGVINSYPEPPITTEKPSEVNPVDSEIPSETSEKTEPASSEKIPYGLWGGEAVYFDVTGDGNDDKCYGNMTGSGMVRVQCIVKDETNNVKYVLDGYDYSYHIEGVEDGRLVVTEKGPYGYGDPLVETTGTVKIINDRLVFVADLDSLKQGLIVRQKTWNDQGTGTDNYTTVTILHSGEIVYDSINYGTIKVDSANDKEVVLKMDGCYVEPNPDGTINLNKESLKEITIKRDETVTLKTQTMDGGVTLEIKYE